MTGVSGVYGLVAQPGRAPGFYSIRVFIENIRNERIPDGRGFKSLRARRIRGEYMKQKEMGRRFKPLEHKLVPHHEILDEKETKKILAEYNIEKEQLPKMLVSDPVAVAIKAKVGDVVRIIRESPTAGKAVFYRLVIAK